jgi:hypothetical protein
LFIHNDIVQHNKRKCKYEFRKPIEFKFEIQIEL